MSYRKSHLEESSEHQELLQEFQEPQVVSPTPLNGTDPTMPGSASPEVGIKTERAKRQSSRKKVAALRGKIMGSRLRLRERFQEIREERTHANDLESKLMESIETLIRLNLIPKQENITELFVQLQDVRGSLGPLEDDYVREEDQHNVFEYELEEAEQLYYSTKSTNRDSGVRGSRAWSVPTEDEINSRNSSSSLHPKDGNALANDYFSRIGDANIIRERLDDLRLELRNRLNEARLRNDVKVDLYAPNVEFVEDFDRAEAKLIAELEGVELDIENLRQQVLASGVQVDFQPSPTIVRPRSPPKGTTFKAQKPLLFQSHQSDSALPGLLGDYTRSRTRINRWILSNLEYSPLERVRHRSILQAFQNDSMDDEQWARHVFEYWRLDGAGGSSIDSVEAVSAADGSVPTEAGPGDLGNGLLQSVPNFSAYRAVTAHDKAFAGIVDGASTDRVNSFPLTRSATRDRAQPYPDHILECDLLSEYQSRSI